MHKIISLFILLMLTLTSPVFAKDVNLQKMEDALGRGYLAASKNDIDTAFNYFTKSLGFAKKARSWKGFIDAGNAFSALGEPKKSLAPLKNAYNIAVSQKDWRGLIAVSYSYAGLPENLGVNKKALSALNRAFKIASSRGDWRGLLEIARAFYGFGSKDKARDVLISAGKIVETSQLSSVATTLAQIARETDNMDLCDKYTKMAKDFGDFEKKYAAPPPGWEPFGESVAGPEKISIAAQIAMRQSADADMISKRKYLAEMKKKEKDTFHYYFAYRKYYDLPYYYNYYGYWRPLNGDQICGWANYYLSSYRLLNGVYVYGY